jgi:hypothetical protein
MFDSTEKSPDFTAEHAEYAEVFQRFPKEYSAISACSAVEFSGHSSFSGVMFLDGQANGP